MKQNIGTDSQNSKGINLSYFVRSIYDFLKGVSNVIISQNLVKRALAGYSTPYSSRNINPSSTVQMVSNDLKSKDKSVNKSPSVTEITKEMIEDYLANFHEIGRKVLNPFIDFKPKSGLFNFGGYIILTPERQEKPMVFDKKNLNFTSLSANKNIIDAFMEVNIDLKRCLTEEHRTNLQKCLQFNEPYFIGTNIVYDEKNIILIKDTNNQEWLKAATEKDVLRIKKEVLELPT